MDIERLKELKQGVSAMAFIALSKLTDKSARENIVRDGNALQDLINAEIARQSVTDEAVQMAIEWQEAEKASAQNDWERAGAEWRMEPGANAHHDERMASFDLAIQALQAYQPTTRKDRIVEEVAISKTETTSCEWCDGGIDTASLMDADMMMRFVRPVNYCPNCGRKLEG